METFISDTTACIYMIFFIFIVIWSILIFVVSILYAIACIKEEKDKKKKIKPTGLHQSKPLTQKVTGREKASLLFGGVFLLWHSMMVRLE